MASITLTVDQEVRDLLRLLVTDDAISLEDIGHAFRDLDRSQAVKFRDQASVLIELLDALGWEGEDSGPREFTVDSEPFRSWLVRQRREATELIGTCVVILARQERGEADHYYGDHMPQESIDVTRGDMERERREVEMLNGVLAQFPLQAAAVA